MPIVKIVTFNLLSDLSRWKMRRPLVVQGLQALQPDLVALQEINIPENTAAWLAHELDFEQMHLSRKTGRAGRKEGIAILSRLPVERRNTLDLKTQDRVAQYVQVSLRGQPLILVNGHFHWQPGESRARLDQVELLLRWLDEIRRQTGGQPSVVVCGDFNGTPETAAIQRMQQAFRSAYAAVHGKEPEYTSPTPLPRSKLGMLRTLIRFFREIRFTEIRPGWRGTLDYIFVDPQVHVVDCQVVLDQPAPHNPQIYPSDHFGLAATLEIGSR